MWLAEVSMSNAFLSYRFAPGLGTDTEANAELSWQSTTKRADVSAKV